MKAKQFISEVISWLLWLGGGLLMAYILVTYVFRLTVVKGESMNNTLESDQVLYVDKLTYRFSEPKRGDIVICSYPGESDNFIKRVIGLPGETIYIKNSVIYIDGNPNVDIWNGNHNIEDMHSVTIPADCYFVMGDNRSNSRDSRDRTVGAIPMEEIMGKAVISFYPFDTFGIIEFKL